MMQVLHEVLGSAFEKWHLNHVNLPSPELPPNCRPVIHRLGVDKGDPHDHPWGFHTFCLTGGYEEEVFVQVDGVWVSKRFVLAPGHARYVPASRVHRVTRLLTGPCFTCVLYGPQERDWRYYPEALTTASA